MLTPPPPMGRVGVQSPEDVVVVAAYRTAITKARKGNFRETTPDDLLAAVLGAVVDKSGTPREEIGDIKYSLTIRSLFAYYSHTLSTQYPLAGWATFN